MVQIYWFNGAVSAVRCEIAVLWRLVWRLKGLQGYLAEQDPCIQWSAVTFWLQRRNIYFALRKLLRFLHVSTIFCDWMWIDAYDSADFWGHSCGPRGGSSAVLNLALLARRTFDVCFVNYIHDWVFSHLSHLGDLILSRSSSVVMQDCKTFNGAQSSNQRHKASLSYRIAWPGTNDEQFGRRWCVPSWARPARVAHLCGILVKFGIAPKQDKWFKKSDSCSCACASNIDLW